MQKQHKFFEAFPNNRKELNDAFSYSVDGDNTLQALSGVNMQAFKKLRYCIQESEYSRKLINILSSGTQDVRTDAIDSELHSFVFVLLNFEETATPIVRELESSDASQRSGFWSFMFSGENDDNNRAIVDYCTELYEAKYPKAIAEMTKQYKRFFIENNR